MEPTDGYGGSTARSRAFSGHTLVDGTPVWPIWHRWCGGVLFWSVVPVKASTTFRGADIRLIDGTSPIPDTPIRCATCGRMPAGPWEFAVLSRPE